MLFRSDYIDTVQMLAFRLVNCLSLVENSIATEFAIWLVDPEIREMATEDRARVVRQFVAKKCRAIRQAEADAMRALKNKATDEAGEQGGFYDV